MYKYEIQYSEYIYKYSNMQISQEYYIFDELFISFYQHFINSSL